MTTLTARALNRATLERQMLLRRVRVDPLEGVRRAVALQAQQPASPYVALWNRLEGFAAEGLDAAFAAREVVKASLMRITLHAVHADDYPAFHAAMRPTLRGARLNDQRFTGAGLTPDHADEAAPRLVEFASSPRTAAECKELLGEEWLWWALRSVAPLHHAPTGGPWSFGQYPSYLAAPAVPAGHEHDDAARHLVRRYLEGFGPASAHDVAQFVLFPRSKSRSRDLLESMGDSLVRLEGPGGAELYDVPGGVVPDEDTPAPPRLMAMWDSTLLAYADRSRMIPPEHRPLVIRRNGDVLPTFLVDGHVAGVWRVVDGAVEATAFETLPEEAWEGLASEAQALIAFLADRDPNVYQRYQHWWKTLPAGHVRLLRP